MMITALLIFFWAVVPGLITGWMLRERGRSFLPGLLLGAVFGPLGILGVLTFIYVADRRHSHEQARGRAVRVFYEIPLVGRLHVSTVWALAGVATFLCLWMVGGVAYEIQRAVERPEGDDLVAKKATIDSSAAGGQTATNPANGAHTAESKMSAAPTQSNTSSQTQAALLGGISAQTGQTAHSNARADNSSFVSSQPASPNVPAPTDAASQLEPNALPMPTPDVIAVAAPTMNPKVPAQSRESVASEAARSLGSIGHKVHASVSGAGRSTTLSLSGASLTRETGNRLLGNGRLRESLKSAGVRIVVMINGQESWTYIL